MAHDSITFDMFREEYMRWREYSGQRMLTVEQMDRVFFDLLRAYVRASTSRIINDKHKKIMEDTMDAACTEHQRRQEYRLFAGFEMKELE